MCYLCTYEVNTIIFSSIFCYCYSNLIVWLNEDTGKVTELDELEVILERGSLLILLQY